MFKIFKKNKSHLSIGVPLIGTVLLGTFGLTFLLQTKVDIQKEQIKMVEKQNELGIQKKEKFDIRKAYFVMNV